jgi:hypothetical protein
MPLLGFAKNLVVALSNFATNTLPQVITAVQTF